MFRVNTVDGANGMASLIIDNFSFNTDGAGFPAPITPVDENFVRIVADQMVFTTQPQKTAGSASSVIIGINETFDVEPIMEAQDAKFNTDIDFNSNVTVTAVGAPGVTLLGPPANFNTGILNFPGITYDLPGDGTIQVQDDDTGLTTVTSAPAFIDVINMQVIELGGPNSVAIGPLGLPPSQADIAYLGFTFTANPGVVNTTEPVLLDITVDFVDDLAYASGYKQYL